MRPSKWYVLYTAPRAEKMVEKRIKGEGIEVFLPLYKSKRKWSDRIKEVELPLFSSYIFVHCNDVKLRTLPVINGVVRVLYYLGKPAVVQDSEIEAIREFLHIAEGNNVITEGDVVTILGSAFECRSGKVVKYSDRYSYLYIEEMGAVVCVETKRLEKNNND